jgi:hypothetical protein
MMPPRNGKAVRGHGDVCKSALVQAGYGTGPAGAMVLGDISALDRWTESHKMGGV